MTPFKDITGRPLVVGEDVACLSRPGDGKNGRRYLKRATIVAKNMKTLSVVFFEELLFWRTAHYPERYEYRVFPSEVVSILNNVTGDQNA